MRKSLLLGTGLLLLAVPAAAAQGGTPADPVEVHVDLHVISFGNYDVNKGTYTMDMYLHFWYDNATAPAGFDPGRFEFMNGRASSKELLADDDLNGTRDLWWRIQANLYTEPRFERYPFDRQHLRLVLEDAIHTEEDLVYVADIQDGNGLDDDVRVSGWRVRDTDAKVESKAYPFDETYSRFTFDVAVAREPLSAGLRSFLPPLAFMVVSGLSFALHPSKVGQRITFGTSMLISAVGFHVSQTVSLPTLGRLTLFDQVMLSCYAFLAASLAVTSLIAHNEDIWKREGASERYNRVGFLASLALPVVVFGVLRML